MMEFHSKIVEVDGFIQNSASTFVTVNDTSIMLIFRYLLFRDRVSLLSASRKISVNVNIKGGKTKGLKMFKKGIAPAAERNKNPILEVLKDLIVVPEREGDFPTVKILELSSGTGQHIAYFAKHLSPKIFWQPTEFDTSSFSSICAYIKEDKLQNVAPPVFVDIREDFSKWNPTCGEMERSVTNVKPITKFEKESFDYIYNSNLIHISAFECTKGLFYNSGKLLKKDGCLITYGPYGQNGVITPESNVQFDAGLKSSNPSWGVRDIQLQLMPLGNKNNLQLVQIIDMPSNNKTLVWKKI